VTESTRTDDRGPDIIAPPPLLYAGPWLAGFVLDLLLPFPRLPSALRLAGLPVLAVGIALAIWFLLAMQRAGTPVDPREATTALVQTGPFRYTRNPAYVAFTLTYLGVSLLTGARWPLILLPAVLVIVDRGVIRREEPYLEERFGSDYSQYRRRVRRWL
jgi:protein-S-isoprenylcysteine O-methyltransferase Ste14